MSHGSGLYIPPYVLRGARQVIPESGAFEPDEFLDLCEHHPGCSAFLAPTMVQRLVADRPAAPAQSAHRRLRRRPDVRRQPEEGDGGVRPDLRPALRSGRGADDDHRAAPRRPRSTPTTRSSARSATRAPGVDVAVLRDDGTPAGVGEIGEIVCRGDVVMSGYWNNPDATGGHAAGRLAAHRRHGLVRRARLS